MSNFFLAHPHFPETMIKQKQGKHEETPQSLVTLIAQITLCTSLYLLFVGIYGYVPLFCSIDEFSSWFNSDVLDFERIRQDGQFHVRTILADLHIFQKVFPVHSKFSGSQIAFHVHLILSWHQKIPKFLFVTEILSFNQQQRKVGCQVEVVEMTSHNSTALLRR